MVLLSNSGIEML